MVSEGAWTNNDVKENWDMRRVKFGSRMPITSINNWLCIQQKPKLPSPSMSLLFSKSSGWIIMTSKLQHIANSTDRWRSWADSHLRVGWSNRAIAGSVEQWRKKTWNERTRFNLGKRKKFIIEMRIQHPTVKSVSNQMRVSWTMSVRSFSRPCLKIHQLRFPACIMVIILRIRQAIILKMDN